MKTTKIYILTDPRDNAIRYVGKTNQKLSARLNSHTQEKSPCHRVHWINQLAKLGMKPVITSIEEVEDGQPWQDRERFWIKHLRFQGHNLTNNTSGGDGVPDLPPETRARLSMVWKGRKHKPETLKLLKVCRPGYKHSESTKANMSKAHKGRAITWADKIADTNRKLSEEDIKNIQSRLLAGEMVKNLASEYGVHRTTMSKIKKGTYYDRYRS